MGNQPIRLIHVGRLEYEKWSDLVVELIRELSRTDIRRQVRIDVFGAGTFSPLFTDLAQRYSFCHYHGHQPKKTVRKIREQAHVTLMPSRFLETFGLSALDALSVGVPVMGFPKWGMQQFVLDTYAVNSPEEFVWSVLDIVRSFDLRNRSIDAEKCRQMASEYSSSVWIERFSSLARLPRWAKVLLVSDYSVDIGGLENLLFAMSDLLESHGYVVKLVWWTDTKPSVSKRYLHLFASSYNKPAGDRIFAAVQDFSPDLIWWHSIHRLIGWYWLRRCRRVDIPQRVMYHDFGLFHPYPSHLYTTKQLNTPFNLTSYLWEWAKYAPWWGGWLLPFKYISTKIIQSQLSRQVDYHLVPSDYMASLINKQSWWKIEVVTLPHFIY